MELSDLFNFTDYDRLLPLVTNSLLAGALLALIGGLVGVFVMTRELSFAVHGIAELSFAGAAIFLLIGLDVVLGSVFGSLIAALIIALMGDRAKDRNSIVAVLMPFGLGLGILALALYPGRAANKFGLLTGQIVAVDDPKLGAMAIISLVVLVGMFAIWRPLNFASLDVEVARARGVNVKALGVFFVMLLGLAVAAAVQIVGALLVLALLVTPAAAALRLSRSQLWVPVLSVAFAMVAMLGGIFLALGAGLPISPYVTTIAFLIYLAARTIEFVRGRVEATR
ncbi:MAG: metal ABC transporter permease [Aquiluna sp.]|nr:metal ABC transporter permease [Aquiluna sp.]